MQGGARSGKSGDPNPCKSRGAAGKAGRQEAGGHRHSLEGASKAGLAGGSDERKGRRAGSRVPLFERERGQAGRLLPFSTKSLTGSFLATNTVGRPGRMTTACGPPGGARPSLTTHWRCCK